VFAPWGGPYLRAGAGVAPGSRVLIELTVDAGYVVLPVDGLADGVRAVSLRGAWGGVQLGVGASF
jgi:hypothetical protein